ncbi:MAG: 50S ribosomal protein L29 [Desulfobulbaceae bacterium S3730MH12]|jgi:large subunit ribosomal protein L29|nr:MAG: 50S ribosomal protein L29 [Desulfobulbaceae bacterium S5133MH15]OEU56733.1 MAG: 50S ribosomal protein L29 [Desulfobulbaceae bacterium S3730MH12]OEU83170.1 MAG: 50S ribosomal protein L29 [Desulfobulbaceae bacterium C00003063]
MNVEDIRKMSAEDLLKTDTDLREELSKLTFQHRIRPLEDTSRLLKIRRDIARIATIQKQTAS